MYTCAKCPTLPLLTFFLPLDLPALTHTASFIKVFGGVIRDAAEMPGDQNSTPQPFKTARFSFQPIPAGLGHVPAQQKSGRRTLFITHPH